MARWSGSKGTEMHMNRPSPTDMAQYDPQGDAWRDLLAGLPADRKATHRQVVERLIEAGWSPESAAYLAYVKLRQSYQDACGDSPTGLYGPDED